MHFEIYMFQAFYGLSTFWKYWKTIKTMVAEFLLISCIHSSPVSLFIFQMHGGVRAAMIHFYWWNDHNKQFLGAVCLENWSGTKFTSYYFAEMVFGCFLSFCNIMSLEKLFYEWEIYKSIWDTSILSKSISLIATIDSFCFFLAGPVGVQLIQGVGLVHL